VLTIKKVVIYAEMVRDKKYPLRLKSEFGTSNVNKIIVMLFEAL
jgi:hypothetical protein